MARKQNDDAETAKGVVALVVVGSAIGWFEAARDFVLARLALFVALVAAVAIGGARRSAAAEGKA